MLNLKLPSKKALLNSSIVAVIVVCVALMGCQSAIDRITPVPVIDGAEET